MSKATIGKLAILAGAPLITGLAFAAEDPANAPQFGEWDVTDGSIDACSTARTNVLSCQVLVKDKGFAQVQIKAKDGKSYVQSILTDFNATGTPGSMQDGTTAAADLLAFYDENYIRINFQAQASTIGAFTYGDPGFMGVQVINDNGDTSSSTWFEATTLITTGWGIALTTPEHLPASPSDPRVATVVELTTDFWTTGTWDASTGTYADTDGTYNGMFDTTFEYTGLNDITGVLLGRDMYIDQDLSLATVDPTSLDTVNDRQTFFFWDRSGELLNEGIAGVWGSTTESADPADIDDPFTGLASQKSINWGVGNTLPPSSDPGIAGKQVIAFYIDQEVTTAGFGQEGMSTFYHLQVDGTGAYDDELAYSQAGTGFAEHYIFEVNPDNGNYEFAMGGMEDWLTPGTPENTLFPPPAYLTEIAKLNDQAPSSLPGVATNISALQEVIDLGL